MSTIQTIQSTDLITNSRADINTNFGNLNTDKIETSTLDTDTTLAADSDAKIATQKAVKAYVDSGGNQNASETARGIVQEATDAQVTAGTATGSTGAKLIVTPAKLATRLVAAYQPINVYGNGVTTRDINVVSGNQTIAHGLGKTPKKVKLTSFMATGDTYRVSSSIGSWDGTHNNRVNFGLNGSTGATFSSSTDAIGIATGDNNPASTGNTGVVTADATNITIAWTKNGSPASNTAVILWEAEA